MTLAHSPAVTQHMHVLLMQAYHHYNNPLSSCKAASPTCLAPLGACCSLEWLGIEHDLQRFWDRVLGAHANLRVQHLAPLADQDVRALDAGAFCQAQLA
eukprot:CAMPEP_0119102562 /NCGR_PEP_ID=MMETSP1180-20130426/1273_1 /TAXON_ID=3052 ORGANISM="Chlamydomonas cf sp, Strain CCMP681" /NCGR_SAMPLE_ID=MMETSP1180 /ASSEMBLY_ACC=CAM_ASM_000741 /LENGTH=98 /DNA_ID=CAMNT_0007086873 /DNA_START=200 /DNA_END=497 /DNA_ORIENTATION=-